MFIFVREVEQIRYLPNSRGRASAKSKARGGHIGKLEVNGLKFSKSSAIFTQAKHGNFATTDLDGLIGGEIFRSFKIIFDYSRRRMVWQSYSLG